MSFFSTYIMEGWQRLSIKGIKLVIVSTTWSFFFLFIALSSARVPLAAWSALAGECRGGRELHQGVVVRKF